MGAMGIAEASELQPWHIMRRTSPTEIHHYGELFEFLAAGCLLREQLPEAYARACQAASADTFAHVVTV